MLSFLKKIILFALPLSFFFVFPVLVMVLGKEYTSLQNVVVQQESSEHTLFSYAYNTSSYMFYKQMLIEARSPTVVALGTSRILEIRKEFFIHQNSFVNAGCPCRAKSLDDIIYFIDNIQASSSVKMLIIGLDQDMFYKQPSSSIDPRYVVLLTPFTSTIEMLRSIYLDYASHKYTLTNLFNISKTSNDIGLAAMLYHNGFRADGSYKYGQSQLNINRIQEVKKQIEEDQYKIAKTNHVATKQQKETLLSNIEKLKNSIELARKKGITVVAFMQPYPEPIYQSMKGVEGIARDLVIEIPKSIASIFYEQGITFFDFSSPVVFGAQDTELIDSLHGTDVMYARMILYMAEHTKELQSYINGNAIKIMIKNKQGDFLNF